MYILITYNLASDWPHTFIVRLFLFRNIITSNDDLQPNTAISDQSPTAWVSRHIKSVS